jgi:hypothetical protein
MRTNKSILIVFTLTLLSWQCKTQPSKSDKRKNVIQKTVNAISRYDTTELYNLVDTSYYFDVNGKEGFLHTINYLHERFKECGNTIVDSLIKIKEAEVYSKEYSIPFCRSTDFSINNRSFDLLVTFANYENPDKIHFIDTKSYFDMNNLKPTLPVQSSKN